jgi:hypothetical protein
MFVRNLCHRDSRDFGDGWEDRVGSILSPKRKGRSPEG